MREQIAGKAHVVWQRWMAYMLTHLDDEHIERWTRQANVAYGDLSESEKESDRAIAVEYLSLIREKIGKVENPYPKAKLASAEYYEGEGFHRACRAILKALEV